ncbi:MAG: histidine phosphatase family protein [Acidimicrobiia bacterium]|nr:histidine phosphatase family protein [Acidimicrobiia bacterium]
MKRLIVLRHGKSDWYAGVASDHARPLNRRGTGAAMTMGRVLTRLGEAPDLIFTSSATRARETALLAADAGGWDCETIEVDDLYGASTGEALRVAARAPDDVERLMLVGHQPAWGYLVRAITGAEVHMKTATVAAIDMLVPSWTYAPEAPGTLAYLLQPRMFTDWEL